MSKKREPEPLIVIPRRTVLHGGLAGLAAAMMTPTLSGCSENSNKLMGRTSGATDASNGNETPDALADAGQSAPDATMTRQDAAAEDARARDAAGADAEPEDAMAEADAGFAEDAGAPADFPSRNIPTAPTLVSLVPGLGALQAADGNGVRLPPGFTSRVVARTGRTVQSSNHRWHSAPDGGATYATENGGWIYVSNSEIPGRGGVGAIRFDQNANIVDAYSILERTNINCAGGKTPWHTWLSCEETSRGQVYECSPWGDQTAIVRPALGTFKHEAVAVDPVNWHLYLTEDESDGCFYRFIPDAMNALGFPDLSSGTLEVAIVDSSNGVTWAPVPDPEYTGRTRTRDQVANSTEFRGGEGIWYHGGFMYFTTKRDNRVWAYDIANATIRIIYDGSGILSGVDNVTVSCCGDVLVAEDGGSMQIIAILPDGSLKPIIQIEGQDDSEITGPAFDPSGTRLYFSSQRGTGFGGITYEVSGPFHRPA